MRQRDAHQFGLVIGAEAGDRLVGRVVRLVVFCQCQQPTHRRQARRGVRSFLAVGKLLDLRVMLHRKRIQPGGDPHRRAGRTFGGVVVFVRQVTLGVPDPIGGGLISLEL